MWLWLACHMDRSGVEKRTREEEEEEEGEEERRREEDGQHK